MFMRFCDDFNAWSPLFPRGSIGGWYLCPLDLPLFCKTAASSIWTISVLPTGLLLTVNLDSLIPDNVEFQLRYFDWVDALGNKLNIFVNASGFFCDYRASSQVPDVVRRVSRALCARCTFCFKRRIKRTEYLYTTKIHSGHQSYNRPFARNVELHVDMLVKADINFLRFEAREYQQYQGAGKWPPLKLGHELQPTAHKVSKISVGDLL